MEGREVTTQQKEIITKETLLHQAFLPGIFGLLGTSFYVLGDTLIVGQALGRDGLASLNLSIPTINLMQGLGLLFGFGGATAMSRALGSGNRVRAKQWAEKTITWSIIAGLALLVTMQLFFAPIVDFLTGGGPARQGAEEYLGILLWFSPFYVMFQSLVVLLRNDSAAKRAMTALLVCSGLNVVLDALFLFGFSMGMFGAGLATGIAQVIGLGVATTHFKKAHILSDLSFRFLPPFRLMGKGMASFVMELSQGVVIFAFNAVLLWLSGEMAVSAYAIIANLSLMFTSIFLGLAQGAQPLLAQAHGGGHKDEFWMITRYAQRVSFIISIGVVAVCLATPTLLAAIFISDDPQVVAITVVGLRIYCVGFLFLGFNLIGTIALQAAAQATHSFVFALSRGMGLLVIYLLIFQHLWGITGVWLAFVAAEMTGFVWMRIALKRL
ncbi:MAG: MATE family efflux transporter [Actinomycetaceae bacterium]|nr:MATE family efflux transporter [Actinomycetaceae bacterium]